MSDESDAWLRLARQDLEVARLLQRQVPPLLEGALYHSQQAAEKALKCVIAAGGVAPPKIHDLHTLRVIAAGIRPTLHVGSADAALLSPYASDPRYPLPADRYVPADGIAAIEAAERILAAVEEGHDGA